MIGHIKDIIQGKADIGVKRSPKWPSVRADHLKKNPTCAVCGGTSRLQVHHIKPFHTHPELELDPCNLITLCESRKYGLVCHLLVGHLGNYKQINEKVAEDAEYLRLKIKAARYELESKKKSGSKGPRE